MTITSDSPAIKCKRLWTESLRFTNAPLHIHR